MKKNARKIFLFFSSRTVGKKGGHPIISCNYTYCHIFVIFLDPQKTASFKLIVQEYRAKTSCGTQWKKSTLKCHEQCNIFALLLTMRISGLRSALEHNHCMSKLIVPCAVRHERTYAQNMRERSDF